MRLLDVSVGTARTIQHMSKEVATAIYKYPVSGPAIVRHLGFEGDTQVDQRVHGGPDKAVLVNPIENYGFYEAEFGAGPFKHGHFGENLTTDGLIETEVRIGDRYRIGEALMEVTMPRMPCFKFGHKLGNPKALARCIETGRTGFYLRVLEEGVVLPGEIIREGGNSEAPTVHEVHELRFHRKNDIPALERCIAEPALSRVVRDQFAERLRELGGGSN